MAALDSKAVGPPIAADRLYDCVNVILSYQNATGGWATYENTRSFGWLEVRLYAAIPVCLGETALPPCRERRINLTSLWL